MVVTSTPVECTPGIDWITLRADGDPHAQAAYEKIRALQIEQIADGDRLFDWGTRGYIGHSTRHTRYGVKEGAVRVELSGALADRYWQEFAALATDVRRLDTKVDVRFGREVRDLAIDAYQAPGVPLGRNLPCITKSLYTGSAGGQTCYVGAMGGARLGRLYDKSAESPRDTAPGVWRWELQEREPFSRLSADALLRSGDVPGYIAAHVHGFFSRHGVTPWFSADSVDLPAIPRRRNSDMSAWLDWLGRQVKPGVRRWSDRAGRDAILDALGLGSLEVRP